MNKKIKATMIVAALALAGGGTWKAYDYSEAQKQNLLVANVEALSSPTTPGDGLWNTLVNSVENLIDKALDPNYISNHELKNVQCVLEDHSSQTTSTSMKSSAKYSGNVGLVSNGSVGSASGGHEINLDGNTNTTQNKDIKYGSKMECVELSGFHPLTFCDMREQTECH